MSKIVLIFRKEVLPAALIMSTSTTKLLNCLSSRAKDNQSYDNYNPSIGLNSIQAMYSFLMQFNSFLSGMEAKPTD